MIHVRADREKSLKSVADSKNKIFDFKHSGLLVGVFFCFLPYFRQKWCVD